MESMCTPFEVHVYYPLPSPSKIPVDAHNLFLKFHDRMGEITTLIIVYDHELIMN